MREGARAGVASALRVWPRSICRVAGIRPFIATHVLARISTKKLRNGGFGQATFDRETSYPSSFIRSARRFTIFSESRFRK